MYACVHLCELHEIRRSMTHACMHAYMHVHVANMRPCSYIVMRVRAGRASCMHACMHACMVGMHQSHNNTRLCRSFEGRKEGKEGRKEREEGGEERGREGGGREKERGE